MNTPTKYDGADFALFRMRVAQSNAAESLVNALYAVGPWARTIMTNAGPCLPTSLAIATGEGMAATFERMQAAYTEEGSVLDGTLLDVRECEGIPAVMAAAVKGVPNRDLVKRVDLEGQTLGCMVKSGRTFVAVVSGGAHAVAIKGGKLYCTAGKSSRMRARFVWEIV